MAKLMKVLLGIVAFIVIAVIAVFYFTSNLTKVADEFFTAVKNKDMDKAYTYLSEDFRADTSKQDLQQFLEKNSLNNYKQASWSSRSISGGRGEISGSITTDSGGVVPLIIDFVKGDDGWKIYTIQKPFAGVQNQIAALKIPEEKKLMQLVNESMSVFSDSVADKSMAQFHAYISNLWQKQYSIEKLDEAFGSFYQLDLNLKVLENNSPQFSNNPSIDENGALIISGIYPTKPKQVHFEQKYIYEGLGWKLFGFYINIQ